MKEILLFSFLFFTTISLTIAQKTPQRVTGKVVKIVDGDTFDLLMEDTVILRVRLNGIDCPERKQDYYQVCKNALAQYIFGKNVTLVTHGKDRWNRTIADVYLNNAYINYKMVKNGFAWHYKKYSNDKKLADAEKDAKKKRLGIWKMKEPVAPWKYRKPASKLTGSKPLYFSMLIEI